MQVQTLLKLTNTIEKLYNKLLVKSLDELQKKDLQDLAQFNASLEEAKALEEAVVRMNQRIDTLYDTANADFVTAQRKTIALTNLVQNKLEDLTKTTVEV